MGSAVDPLQPAHTASEAPPNKPKFLQEKSIFERRVFGGNERKSGASDRRVKNERIGSVLSYGACGVEGSQAHFYCKIALQSGKLAETTPVNEIGF